MKAERRLTDAEKRTGITGRHHKWPKLLIRENGKLYSSTRQDNKPLSDEEEKEALKQRGIMVLHIGEA